MSKRDDDSQADLEVGMTTAERRRRRRRGGSLRVPSDNVPRRANPPVVAPVPEDPSLAMSIAYSFSNDASEPVPRMSTDVPSSPIAAPIAPNFPDPVAPEPIHTLIDPINQPIEQADFEMKTREMTAVDLEALGLANDPSITDPGLPGVVLSEVSDSDGGAVEASDGNGSSGKHVTGQPRARPRRDETAPAIPTLIPSELSSGPVSPVAEQRPRRASREPIHEPPVRSNEKRPTLDPPLATPSAPITPITPPVTAKAEPEPTSESGRPLFRMERQKTVALSEEDLEEVREAVRVASEGAALDGATKRRPSSNESVPEIDIQELAERTENTGEIDVDIDDGAVVSATAREQRARPPSVPPPIAPPAATTSPGINPPAHAPPPLPPAAKAPPTPPPVRPAAKIESRASAARTTSDSRPPPRGKAWFVDLFDEDYLRTLPFLTPQATQAEAEFVIDAMGISPGAQLLDLGCGYGRHAMELAARGYHVVGLDMSTPLLVRGGEEAQRRGLQINFIRGDMRELDFESQFDGVYCLFSTFGYFDDETNKKTIANVARALKPGGRLLVEILNRDYLIADLPTRVWWEGDGCVVLEEVELNYFSSRIQINRSLVFDDGRQLEQEISVRAYSLHEVGKLLHAAGFRVLEVSGGYHTRGRFFGNQSRHIIVLAERKD